MESIITEIAENFIKKLVEIMASSQKSFAEIEKAALEEAKSCATKLMGAYAESLDLAIIADKVGRREMGSVVHRRGDKRSLQTLVGEISYHRTYYKKASGGYEYLADRVLGIERRERVSSGLSLALATAAKDMSYAKSSCYVSGGEISRQTVMSRVRKSGTTSVVIEKHNVAELHIDADEAHISLQNSSKSIVPLISVYEGIERHGKRNSCKNVFHISEYGKSSDDLWEQTLTEIEQRYDLTNTKIYLHGDGAKWIQTGLEWIPDAVFVLDKYHKNKAIKQMTTEFDRDTRKLIDENIREALADEDVRFFDELTQSICSQNPQRTEKILEAARYLKNFIGGISVCKTDPAANNGGCTEPHVSHILASRLSSRPMAWSRTTLKKLAPVLASGQVVLNAKADMPPLPKPLRKAAASATRAARETSKAFRRGTAGLPNPDSIGKLPVSGKITGTQKILKFFR